jgi:O-antigen ligase
MKKITGLCSRDNLLSLVLSLFVISLYFDLRYTILSTALLLVAGAGVILHCVLGRGERLGKPRPIVWCWAGVYLVRVIWLTVAGDDLRPGLKWLDTSLPFLLFPALFQYLPLTERVIKAVLTVFVRFTALFCVLTVCCAGWHIVSLPVDLGAWLRHPKDYFPLAFKWAGYDHPSFLCVIYLLALPVSLYLRRKFRACSILEIGALILLEGAVIVLTGTRVGVIVLPLLGLMMLMYALPRKRRAVVIGLTAALLSAAIMVMLLQGSQLLNRFKDPIRTQLWETTVASIKERPLLGVGTGEMEKVLTSPELATALGYHGALRFSYPHNQYLGEVMHFGFVGAVPLFGTLIYLLVLAIRRKNFLLLALMAVIFVFMMTEMPFDMSKGINLFMFFSCLLLLQVFDTAH